MIALAYFSFFLSTLVLSVGCTWYIRNLAVRRQWVQHHHNSRNIHSQGIPRLGGVGIFLAFNGGLLLLLIGYRLIGRNPEFLTGVLASIMPAALLIFLLGLADDLFDIRAWIKFGVQVCAALILYSQDLRVHHLADWVSIYAGPNLGALCSIALTVLWVVGITNAFNLIDGLDGLAAGSALFSTFAVFMTAMLGGNRTIALLTIGLSAAILGFLRFNFNPASIFLGDSGSLFLGFMLSAIALAGVQKSPTLVAVAIPVVACGLPILDTLVAMARRMLGGKSIFSSDREHIHHKLLNRGLSHKQVVILLYGVSALCAFLSLFLLYPGGGPVAVVIAVLGIGAWLGIQQLDYREINELKRLARRTVDQKKIIANNIAVHEACEKLAQTESMAELTDTLQILFQDNAFDAFELSLNDDTHAHSWSRSGIVSAEGGWRIVVPLFASDRVEQGKLSLYRGYSNDPLLLDINLITHGFPTSLGNAIARAKDAKLSIEVSG